MKKLTTKEFIERSKDVHEIKYDYSKTEYNGRHEKVCVICPEHGEFWQEAGHHLKGGNCPKCPCQYSQSKFLAKAKEVHGDKYDYSKVKYTKMHDKVIIICPEHGEFLQKPYKHLNGQGCPICGQHAACINIQSSGENFIENWLITNKIKFKSQFPIITNVIARDSNLLIVDFYIEYNNKKIIIEYNGKQHYTYTPFFYKTREDFNKQKRRDKVLRNICILNDIELLEIKYTKTFAQIDDILSKMFSIKFNFDPETEKITNLEVEKIKTIDEQIDGAVISVEDNKLKLSKDAINLLNVKAGDRVSINYYTVSPEETFPVIAPSDRFTDKDGGNRLNKSNTISFRGEQRKILLRYGNLFKLEPFKNWFKMVKVEQTVENDSLVEEENDLNNLEN